MYVLLCSAYNTSLVAQQDQQSETNTADTIFTLLLLVGSRVKKRTKIHSRGDETLKPKDEKYKM